MIWRNKHLEKGGKKKHEKMIKLNQKHDGAMYYSVVWGRIATSSVIVTHFSVAVAISSLSFRSLPACTARRRWFSVHQGQQRSGSSWYSSGQFFFSPGWKNRPNQSWFWWLVAGFCQWLEMIASPTLEWNPQIGILKITLRLVWRGRVWYDPLLGWSM